MFVAVAGTAVWLHAKNNTPPRGSCLGYGSALIAWPYSIQVSADESYGVVVGTVLNDEVPLMTQDENEPIRLRVTDVIKGSALHKDDVLQLCAITLPINFINGNHHVLVFLDGKDDGWWVVSGSDLGIVPQSKDGRFKPKWATEGKTSTTADELKKQIK